MLETLMRCGACPAEDEPDCIRCGLCVACRPKFYAVCVSGCSHEMREWLAQYLPTADGYWVYEDGAGGGYKEWPEGWPEALVWAKGGECRMMAKGDRGRNLTWPLPVDVGLVAGAVKAARDAKES